MTTTLCRRNTLSYPFMAISPTAEGFRAAFRRPSLTLAEMMWRWTAGATAAALLVFGLFQYLDTLPVTNGELLFLRTRHPYLVAEAIAHILRGSLGRAVLAGLLAALMLMVLWIVAASVGRIATVRVLLDYFRRDVAGIVSAGGVGNDGERDVASNVSTDAFCTGLQVFEIALHCWLEVSVDDYRRGAFVLAEFGKDLVRDGERGSQPR
jgi:hypothetical protein